MAALQETYSRPDSAGVAVIDGFGVRIVVERGALEVHDGVGPHRRTRRYDKASHGLSRLVVLNAAGIISLDALKWCSGLGIGVLVLGPDGTCQLASTPRMTDDARLRRVQALAPDQPYGLDIARWLIGAQGSRPGKGRAPSFGDEATAETLGELVLAIEDAGTIDEIRQLEATAAALYFGSWSDRPETAPHFAPADRRRIPPHWSRFEGRRSVLASSASNRKAERPVNSILNYLFALVEAEAILACQAVGSRPGIRHRPQRTRRVASRSPWTSWSRSARLSKPSCSTLSSSARSARLTSSRPRMATSVSVLLSPTDWPRRSPSGVRRLAPIAEHVAHVLGSVMAGKYHPATPLTGSNVRDAQAVVKARKAATRLAASSTRARQRPVPGQTALPLWTCPDCGGAVTNPRHVRCEACIAADPAQAPEIRGRRGAAIAARKRAFAEWDKANPGAVYDPELFRREILPRLAAVKLTEIAEAAGCSKAYASDIRRGKWTPHLSTWAALAASAGNGALVRPVDASPLLSLQPST